MSLVLVLILLACLFGPPLLGGLTAGLLEYCQAKKEGRPLPSLLLPFPGFFAGLRQPAADRWALQWALRDKAVTSALIGASKPEQVVENAGALSAPKLTAEELSKIDRILSEEG